MVPSLSTMTLAREASGSPKTVTRDDVRDADLVIVQRPAVDVRRWVVVVDGRQRSWANSNEKRDSDHQTLFPNSNRRIFGGSGTHVRADGSDSRRDQFGVDPEARPVGEAIADATAVRSASVSAAGVTRP